MIQRPSFSWLILLSGLVLTLMAAVYMKSISDRVSELNFDTHCGQICAIIKNRLDDHARILLGSAALFNASDKVTREGWRAFNQYQKLEKQLPGIQGIGFSLLIPRADLARHIQDIRGEGFPEYTVKPEGDREFYSSIIYLEPFSGRNLRAFGYDMFSEPVRRLAMERARDTDAASLSGKVVLVQETGEAVQSGSLMYVPVYRKGMPVNTVEQRRAAIYGWVYSPYRMTDLMRGILGVKERGLELNLHLEVFDGAQTQPQTLLFEVYPATEEGAFRAGVRFTRQIPVEMNGHRWTLRLTQAEAGYFAMEYIKIWLTLVGGMFITGLLFILIRVLQKTPINAQRLAEELTANLRESETSYRNQFSNNSAVMLLVDPESGAIIDANASAVSFYGYPRAQLLAMNISDINSLTMPEVREKMASVPHLRGKRFEFQHRLADNSLKDVEVAASRIQFGGCMVLHSIITDVTERKAAEALLRLKTALLEAQMNATPEGILVIDKNQKRVLINQRIIELFHVPEDILQDNDDTQLLKHVVSLTKYPDQFLEKVISLYGSPSDTSRDEIELRSGVVLDRYSAPVIGKDGENYGRLWTFRDITGRKHAEETLRKMSERLALATRAGNVGIWDWDIVNNILVWDDQMYRLYGITSDKFSGAYPAWRAGLHPDDRERGDLEIQMALRGEKEFDTEFRVLWPDGTIHDIRALALIQRDAGGHPLRMTGTNWEVTVVKQTERALIEANRLFSAAAAQAKELATNATQENRAKSRFLAHMSHEIRTPLNAILGFSQLLQQDQGLALSQKQRVEIINSSGEHLLALLNNILELSKIEAGGVELSPISFDFHAMMNDLILIFRIRAEAKHLSLHLEGLEQGLRYLFADEQKLRQVLINLLSNAVKYTASGSIQVRVSTGQRVADEWRLNIVIEDSGSGIAAEEMNRLFIPFEQTSSGRSSHAGTGLGLAISRQFARLMGGDVTGISEVGKGSVFRLELPVKEGTAIERPDMRHVLRLEEGQPRCRILVAEDDADSRLFLFQLLGGAGFDVVEATNGKEAVEAFIRSQPQLVLMDDWMPFMQGDEAISQIRQKPGGARVKIITLTANASDETRHRSIAAGTDIFMAKPFQARVLFDHIQVLLGVRYIYAEFDPTEDVSPEVLPVLTREMLDSLPGEIRSQLRVAALGCRQDQLLKLTHQLTGIAPEMARSLQGLVVNFEYHALSQLLN